MLLLISLLLASPMALAKATDEECPSVDLSDKFGPIRNQGSAGFCYSFAAADVLGEALDIRPPKMVSPMYLAAQYVSMSPPETQRAVHDILFEDDSDQSPKMGMLGPDPKSIANYDPRGKPLLGREGGYPNLIIAHALELPKICSETDVPSEGTEPSRNVDRDGFFLVRMGEMADGDHIQAYFNARNSNSQLPECLNDSPLKRMVGSIEELRPAIQDYAAGVFKDATAAKCTQTMPPNLSLKVHTLTITPTPKLIPNLPPGMGMGASPAQLKIIQDSVSTARKQNSLKISNILFKNQRPIAISYNACVLVACKDNENRQHASVVIAQQWNSQRKRCEVKIRNSWGTNCDGKRDDVDCVQGNWWVDREELANNSNSATWVDSK